MSLPSNDINPDIATKLPSNGFNSDDVILNIEGRKRMRRPYERYMQQQAMQKSLENAAADATMVHKLHKQSENHQSSDIIHSNETVTSHNQPLYSVLTQLYLQRNLERVARLIMPSFSVSWLSFALSSYLPYLPSITYSQKTLRYH